MMQRVIVIEDEKDIVELLSYTLRKEGFDVRSAGRGQEGLELLQRGPAALALIDIMLPDLDGLEVCRRLREDKSLRNLPVIFLTAKGEEVDRILGLDTRTQEVIVRGQPIELSTLEFRLLHFLASHPRRIFARENLLDEVWGRDRFVTPRTVDVHIRRLREKIEIQPEKPRYLQTVRGSGYRFTPLPLEESEMEA